MVYDRRKLHYILFSVIVALIAIIILCNSYLNDLFPSRKFAGKINISNFSVSINNQLIPSYDLKSGVYIAAEDLRLFGFDVSKSKTAVVITSPKSSSINNEYFTKLSDIDEEEKAFYPQENVTVNGTKIASYKTKDFTLIPVNVLDRLGECSKESKSTHIRCDLYN